MSSLDLSKLDLSKVEWVIDPIQDDQIKEKMRQSSTFAEALMKNKTPLFFHFLKHKPVWREPVTLEIMGSTRSGKSTLGTGVCKFESRITQVPFTLQHICPNETIYLDTVKTANAPDGSSWLIDEQSLSTEEEVITDKGLVKLKDIAIDETINVLSFDFNSNKLEFVPATKVRNKIKPIFMITTKTGKTITATEDHVFFIKTNEKIEEKRLRDLKEGDELICL